jgi:hypothetical protein
MTKEKVVVGRGWLLKEKAVAKENGISPCPNDQLLF